MVEADMVGSRRQLALGIRRERLCWGHHGKQLTSDGLRANIGAKSLRNECFYTSKCYLLDNDRPHPRILAGGGFGCSHALWQRTGLAER